jgi:polyisoprenyl-teichoic acid--peptidoglycan teichoic acid transferase
VTIDVPAGSSAPFAPGRRHLDGPEAVAYLKGESGVGYGRVGRTQQVEQALLTQANPANVLLQFRTVAAASAGAVVTDLPQDVLTDLTVLALKSRTRPVRPLELVPPVVPDPSAPDYAAVQRLVATAIG